MPPRLAVFCGSAPGSHPRYLEAAGDFGRAMANRGVGLVYGGASIGLMRALADAVLLGGAEVDGVMPEFMIQRELLHPTITRAHRVPSMHARKALMAELADAFVALPGGWGTLDELFEILTWRQIRLHDKPVGILNVDGFFDPLLQFVDHQTREGFVKPPERPRLLVERDGDTLLSRLFDSAS